jgi:hypothetical protein
MTPGLSDVRTSFGSGLCGVCVCVLCARWFDLIWFALVVRPVIGLRWMGWGIEDGRIILPL